ncbi:RHS repeat-associated core domain-containing protein [Caulobacter mirabilis]|uniref:RHS repeat-associated core domain-containing protein n=1 Tax=Caulobacter mirabilis TaxID=69666 RepID=UPI001C0EEBC6|nr:RHS repeat-associated core domain-containing protein [Caulobacter mirabilis]
MALLSPGEAFSQTPPAGSGALAGMRFYDAEQLSPAAAKAAYYDGATSATTYNWASAKPIEITATAAALENDPQKIFLFVKNHVRYEPRFGAQKGALGAIIDRSGTAFDQAQLLVELLRAAGITASYQVGTITLTGAQFNDWLGLTDPAAARQFLANGGIPATVTGTGTISQVEMGHAWVSAVIGGATVTLDPSYKAMDRWTQINVATEAGLSPSSFVATAATPTGSGTESGVAYVTGVNLTGAESALNSTANTLLTKLKTTYKDKRSEEIMGGERIRPAADPWATPTTGVLAASWGGYTGGLPDKFRTKLTVEAGNCRVDLFVDEIYGKRLVYHTADTWEYGPPSNTHSVGGQGFSLQGPLPAGASSGCLLTPAVPGVRISANLPYAARQGGAGAYGTWMDRVSTKEVDSGVDVIIAHGWGDTSSELQARVNDDFYAGETGRGGSFTGQPLMPPGAEYWGPPYGSQPTQSEKLKGRLYSAWLAQMTRGVQLVEGASNTLVQHHYTIGVAYTQIQHQVHDVNNNDQHDAGEMILASTVVDEAVRLDLDSGFSTTSLAGVAVDKTAARHTIAALGGMLEGSLFEQQTDAVETASTAQRFGWGQENLAGSIRYHRLLPGGATVAQYREGLVSYKGVACTGQATANQAYTVIQANDRYLGPGSVVSRSAGSMNGMYPTGNRAAEGDDFMHRGCAWVAFNGDGSEIAHVVTSVARALKGGGGTASAREEAQRTAPMQGDLLKDEFKDRSNLEGVDLRTGAYTYRPAPDLVVGQGEFPYALSFQRIYQNGGESCPKCLRGGWTHNFDIRATSSGGGLEAMGGTTPLSLAAPMVAIKAAFEVYKADAQSAPHQLAGLGVMRWLSRHLTNNVVTVRQGASSETFVRVADGTLAAAPSSQSKLVQTGQRRAEEYTQYARSSTWIYDQVSYVLTQGGGDQIAFGWKVWNPNGRRGADDGNDYEAVKGHEQGFFANSWTFPTGVALTFTYCTDLNIQYGGHGSDPLISSYFPACADKLKRVSSNLGVWIDINRMDAKSSDGRSTTVVEDYLRNPDGSYRWNYPVAKSFVDAAGQTWTYRWEFDFAARPSPWPRLMAVTEPGRTTPQFELAYDKLGRVRTWRDADSLAQGAGGPAYTYYAPGMGFGARKDPLNGVVRISYDTDDRAIAQADELGRTTYTTYDARGRVATRLLPWLERQEFAYDDRNNVVEKRRISNGAPDPWWRQTIILKAQYHPTWNKPVKVTLPVIAWDSSERDYDYSYNAQGLVQTVTEPQVLDGVSNVASRPIWTMTYDAFGRPATATDPTGRRSSTAYGQNGQPAFCKTSTTEASQAGGLNLTSTFACDARGDVTSAADPRGNVSTTSYDALRRKTETLGPAGTGIRTQWSYDVVGRVLEQRAWDATAGVWRTSATAYSPAGRALAATDPSGDIVRTCYDLAGRETIKVDPEGRATRTSYNLAGEPTLVERWFRASVTDPSCALTAELPAGQTTHAWRSYGYMASGLIASESDARGNATTFQYDGLGRKMATTYPDPDGAGPLPAPVETVFHNQRGQLQYVQHRKHAGDDRWTIMVYDPAGRLSYQREQDDPTTASPVGRLSRNTYDLAGRRVFKDVSQQTTAGVFDVALIRDVRIYSYDPAGRVTNDLFYPENQTSGGPWFQFVYGYDAAGNRTSVQWPDGWTATYGFDAANRMATVSFTGGSGTWTYDSQSRPTHFARSNGTGTAYGYEPDSDLQQVTHTFAAGSPLNAPLTYTRDKAGLILYRANPAAYDWTPTLGYARTYGAANALNQLASEAGASLAFDGRGNMTSDGDWTFAYDMRNRLRGATKPGTTATYEYDGDDRRTKKTVNGVVTRMLWSGQDELAEADAAGNILRRYVPGASVDTPLATVTPAGTVTWLHADGQGSIINSSNSAGAAGTPVTYSPYGEMSGALPANVPFGYTGRYHDAETGLWYYRARYYHPRLGQFLQVDPVGTKDDPNLTLYVGADPVNKNDPTGKQAMGFEIGQDRRAKKEVTDGVEGNGAPTPPPPPLVTVSGGTAAQRALVVSETNKGFSTERGKELAKIMRDRDITRQIILAPGSRKNETDIGTGNIKIDPTSVVSVPTTTGMQDTPMTVVIMHEIGHSVTGMTDEGPYMQNIRHNENPIRKELGLPERTGSGGSVR